MKVIAFKCVNKLIPSIKIIYPQCLVFYLVNSMKFQNLECFENSNSQIF